MNKINNFVVINSAYGNFLINRKCHFQAETLIKTGYTHIESELANIFVIIDKLPTSCLVVDGGANAGFFTVPVAQRIKSKLGVVLSFEPQMQIFNGLAGTLALNDLDNVRLNRMGLGNLEGSATLPKIDYSIEQDFGVVEIVQDKVSHTLHDFVLSRDVVRTIRIDDLYLPRLDFFKLDIEGFEIPALEGSRTTVNRCRPFLWIEYWKTGLDSIRNELDYLDNYSFFVMDALNVLFAPNEKLLEYGISVNVN